MNIIKFVCNLPHKEYVFEVATISNYQHFHCTRKKLAEVAIILRIIPSYILIPFYKQNIINSMINAIYYHIISESIKYLQCTFTIENENFQSQETCGPHISTAPVCRLLRVHMSGIDNFIVTKFDFYT